MGMRPLVHEFTTLCTFNIYLSTCIVRGDQKVRGKVPSNRIAFIDCNENSQI